MTTRTRENLVCECGHEGYISCKETDQPYGGLWERYSLQGFSGRGVTVTSYADMPKDLLAYMAPTCPQCGKTGKVSYAKGP